MLLTGIYQLDEWEKNTFSLKNWAIIKMRNLFYGKKLVVGTHEFIRNRAHVNLKIQLFFSQFIDTIYKFINLNGDKILRIKA